MKTEFDIKSIRQQLPYGSQTEIAKAANVSLNTVHRVLRGKSENGDVMNAIVDYLTKLNKKREKTADRLSSLIK